MRGGADGWQLLDVRSRGEHAFAAIPGSRNIPLADLREEMQELTDAPIVVYCEVGQRGHTATALLRSRGRRVRNLEGGFRTWCAAEAARLSDPDLVESARTAA